MFKKILFCFLITTLPHVAQADTLTQLKQCSATKDNLARLNCYDSLVKIVIQGNTPNNSNTAKAVIQPPISKQLDPIDNFGKEHIKQENKQTLNKLELIIETLTKDAYGAWVITFTNGQKWKQSDQANLKLKKGNTVELQKGLLSAVYLKTLNANKRIKVKRIK